MRPRRGVALIAALWLVVAIAAVAVQFSIDAKERRTIGLDASERGIQRAAAAGGFALTQARLEYALRVAPSGNNIARLRAADPWLDIDSIFSGTVYVDSMPVEVRAHDMGMQLNVNLMQEVELRTFFQYAIGDYTTAEKLAQSILDWRDTDSIPRIRGAERDAYIKAELLALPTNSGFREVSELLNVMGMTPEIYALVSPYLRTRGSATVNLNTAPVLVLRSLPGMTDQTLNYIMQLRSQGRRISNMSEIAPPGRPAPRPGQPQQNPNVLINQIANRSTLITNEVEITVTARVGPQARPSRLVVVLGRTQGNTATTINFKQW